VKERDITRRANISRGSKKKLRMSKEKIRVRGGEGRETVVSTVQPPALREARKQGLALRNI